MGQKRASPEYTESVNINSLQVKDSGIRIAVIFPLGPLEPYVSVCRNPKRQ